jgi:hypothetical protein
MGIGFVCAYDFRENEDGQRGDKSPLQMDVQYQVDSFGEVSPNSTFTPVSSAGDSGGETMMVNRSVSPEYGGLAVSAG